MDTDLLGGASGARLLDFTKGHGTGNDFIIIDAISADPIGDLSVEQVRAICDRRTGIGADGVLRILRTDAGFFMDYRNADGSLAQMCGNGMRVTATYLHRSGLLAAGAHVIGTRGGDVPIRIDLDGQVTVTFPAPAVVAERCDVAVAEGAIFAATAVTIPNPHCVVILDSLVGAGALSQPPSLPEELFDGGANVEFVRIISEGHIEMRVWERGVGETLSCGSGACAAAWVAAASLALPAPWRMLVDVPGGQLTVACDDSGALELSGPAVLVASGAFRWEAADVAGGSGDRLDVRIAQGDL